jgi:hypothetical protein
VKPQPPYGTAWQVSLQDKGYSVTRERPHSLGADGETDPIAKAVRIDPTHAPLHQLVTLGHEAAHVDLDHIADMASYRTHRGPFEIEAESSAFIFFAAHGIDSGASSFEYIDGWCRNDLELILKTAGRSIESAQRLIEAIDGPVIERLPPTLALDQSTGIESNGIAIGL